MPQNKKKSFKTFLSGASFDKHLIGSTTLALSFEFFAQLFRMDLPLNDLAPQCRQEFKNFLDKFDEIFNSAKYKNCLKHIKDVRKLEMDKAKMDKNSADHYRFVHLEEYYRFLHHQTTACFGCESSSWEAHLHIRSAS